MSTANPCRQAQAVHLPPGRIVRALRALGVWFTHRAERWHAAHQARAEWRALQGLSDATLRDIGMAQRRYDAAARRDQDGGIW